MFTNVANRKANKEQKPVEEADTVADSVQKDENGKEAKEVEEAGKDAPEVESKAEGPPQDAEVEEKEQILEGVRKMAMSMQSDIKDLLKNEWAGSINNLEGEKKKAESERQESLKKAKDD